MPSRNIGKMNQRTISHLSSFWLVLVLAFGLSGAFTVIPKPFRNNYVRIVNNLNNELLYYHCKSRDTDFHLKNLQPNTYWEFSFRQNVIGTTLYYCKFWQYNFHAVFDVFTSNEKFQRECGGDHCIWIAQEDGVYLYELKSKHLWRCLIEKSIGRGDQFNTQGGFQAWTLVRWLRPLSTTDPSLEGLV